MIRLKDAIIAAVVIGAIVILYGWKPICKSVNCVKAYSAVLGVAIGKMADSLYKRRGID